MERKLAAILCADVSGYSRLMGQNEETTLATLTSHRKVIDSLIEQYRGRFVNSAGDSVLAEFASVVNAVQCAIEIQTALSTENSDIAPERRMEFRIGVNLGDVMVEGEQIYGDGVNVAARLESLAPPGGICVSAKVHDEVAGKLSLSYQDLGPQRVKNIAEPVRVFRVLADADASAASALKDGRARKLVQRGAFSLAGVAIIVGTIVLVQHLSLRPPAPSASIPPIEKPLLPLPSMPSIAVLPFSNLSDDPRQEYFSDGITDELISQLAQQPGLFVIARTSSFTFKHRTVTIQEVGHELGVRYVLEGSVQRAANRARIAAQLVDASSGADLWAQRFDRPLTDIFAMQDDVVKKIVSILDLQVGLQQQGVFVHQDTDNLEAYDDFLRGLTYNWRTTKEDNGKALQMYQKALKLDPQYADAYVAIGGVYFQDWVFEWSQDPHTLEQALGFTRKAIALNDGHPVAHVLLGRLLALKGQCDTAIVEAERAIALAPYFAFSHYLAAETLNQCGKPDEAIEIAKTAMRLDPVQADFYQSQIGFAYVIKGNFKDAVPALTRFFNAYPRIVGLRPLLVVSYVELGMMEQARAQVTEILKQSPHFSLEKGVFQGAPQSDPFIADLRKAGFH